MSIKLKVKTEVLVQKSDDITKSIDAIDKDFQKIDELITGTKKYWQGDASDVHMKHYIKMKDDFTMIVERLREHPKDLKEMAGVYRDTEDDVTRIATALPTDVITY